MEFSIAKDTLGKRIKAQRIQLGLSQEELAEKSKINKKTISAYETDKCDIKAAVIVELAVHLKTTPDYLLGFTEDPFVEQVACIAADIKDEKVREALLMQLKALAGRI